MCSRRSSNEAGWVSIAYYLLPWKEQWLPAEAHDRAARTNNRVWFACIQKWLMQKGQKMKTAISVVKNLEILSHISIQLNHPMPSKYAFSSWFFFPEVWQVQNTPKYNWVANVHRSPQKIKGFFVGCLPEMIENC